MDSVSLRGVEEDDPEGEAKSGALPDRGASRGTDSPRTHIPFDNLIRQWYFVGVHRDFELSTACTAPSAGTGPPGSVLNRTLTHLAAAGVAFSGVDTESKFLRLKGGLI